MPQVDFYILESNRPSDLFACQLADKIRQQALSLFICTDDEPAARAIDQRLWTYHDISFLAHEVYPDESTGNETLIVSWQNPVPVMTDVFMNLGNQLPVDPNQFSRIVDIVAADDNSREAGRQRYRHYRDQGLALESHTIS